jgi:hypothetical protein
MISHSPISLPPVVMPAPCRLKGSMPRSRARSRAGPPPAPALGLGLVDRPWGIIPIHGMIPSMYVDDSSPTGELNCADWEQETVEES